MNIGVEVVNADELTPGECDAAVALATLDGVLRLLDEAAHEDEGERFLALVAAAHDFGSVMFHQIRGCCEAPDVKAQTMELLLPLMNRSVQ